MLLWTRRHLLAGLLRGAFAVFAIASIPGCRAAFASRDAALARCVDELLPDPAGARAIDRLYLNEYPEAMRRTRALGSALRAQPDAAARRAALWARRRRDLAAEDVVLIDGWLLAATEAELCALALLAA
jgi:hypothetical protein